MDIRLSSKTDVFVFIISSPPDSICADIMFFGDLSAVFVCLFDRTYLVTMTSHDWLEQP